MPSLAEPTEIKTMNLLETVCILFGMLSRVNDGSVRTAVCKEGILNCLMRVLHESSHVVGAVDEKCPDRLMSIRRLAEQAIMLLATTPRQEQKNGGYQIRNGATLRWNSCSFFQTDLDLFPAAVEGPPAAPDAFPCSLLLEIIATEGDHDLANRGSRILSAVVQSVDTDLNEFLGTSFLPSVNIMPKLSAVVEARATEVLNAVEARNAVKVAPSEAEGAEAPSDAPIMVGKQTDVQLLTPSVYGALYHSLCLVHILMKNNSEHVNTFATDARLMLLAQIGYMCGPVGANGENNSAAECKVRLIDARCTNWPSICIVDPLLSHGISFAPELGNPVEQQLLRTLLFDVFSDVACADKLIRTFSSETPAPIANALPDSTCVCEEASLRVAKYCADVCVATLQVSGKFALSNGRVIMTPNSDFEFPLALEVLEACVRTVGAVGSIGVTGVFTALNNIGGRGLNTSNVVPTGTALCESSAIASLERFISAEISPEYVSQGDKALPWRIPSLFNEYFIESDTFVNAEKLPNEIENVATATVFWPFLTLCGGLLSILSNPYMPCYIVEETLKSVESLCRSSHFENFIQPVLMDVMCSMMLSMGGGVILPSCMGRFGTAPATTVEYNGLAFVSYLYNRGRARESVWTEYAQKKAEEAAAAAAELAAKGGKAPPAAKAEKQKGAPVAHLVELHHTPSEGHIDPNHGPDCNMWLKLLNLCFDDVLLLCNSSCPLVSCIQSGLVDLSALLISDLHVEVNMKVNNCTPLMYALVLQEPVIVEQLIVNGLADVNAIDDLKNPCIKFGCLSLSSESVASLLSQPYRRQEDKCNAGDRSVIKVLGSSNMLHCLTDAGVDVNVSDDVFGNYPLHYCSGLGEGTIEIGGYSLYITNDAYDRAVPGSDARCQEAIQLLHASGAKLNSCNGRGQTVLHVIAAHSDLVSLKYCIRHGAEANAIDKYGMSPLAYVCIGSESDKCIESFDLLLKYCVGRGMDVMEYSDDRTGKTVDAKYDMDIDSVLESVFDDVCAPLALQRPRMQHADVLLLTNHENLSLFHLVMCAQTLYGSTYQTFSRYGSKQNRMELALHIYETAAKYDVQDEILCTVDVYGMNMFHAASLLFVGITPQKELTRKEHTKRNKKYASIEIQLLELLFNLHKADLLDLDGDCSRRLLHHDEYADIQIDLPSRWTAIHGCIMHDNYEMLEKVLTAKPHMIQWYPYVYFAACIKGLSPQTAKLVVDASSSCNSVVSNQLLNERVEGVTRPIFAAIRNENMALLNELVKCGKCSLGLPDMASCGRSPVHEIIHCALHSNKSEKALEMLQVFEQYASDRVDLLLVDNFGYTCIDEVVQAQNLEFFQLLVCMRKNDVAEKLLSVRSVEHFEDGKMKENAVPEVPEEPQVDDAPGLSITPRRGGGDEHGIAYATGSLLFELEKTYMVHAIECGFHDYVADMLVEEAAKELEVTENSLVENVEALHLEPDAEEEAVEAVEKQPKIYSHGIKNEEIIRREQFLMVVLDLLSSIGNNVVDADAHAHVCFHNGILFTEYCENSCGDNA